MRDDGKIPHEQKLRDRAFRAIQVEEFWFEERLKPIIANHILNVKRSRHEAAYWDCLPVGNARPGLSMVQRYGQLSNDSDSTDRKSRECKRRFLCVGKRSRLACARGLARIRKI